LTMNGTSPESSGASRSSIALRRVAPLRRSIRRAFFDISMKDEVSMIRRTTGVRVLFWLVALVTALQAQAPKAQTITAAEAENHIGDTATVCGQVASTKYAASSRGQPTFINLDKPYPSPIFTVLIWGLDRAKFGSLRRPTATSRFVSRGAYGSIGACRKLSPQNQRRSRFADPVRSKMAICGAGLSLKAAVRPRRRAGDACSAESGQ
jgi:hypothetical protein